MRMRGGSLSCLLSLGLLVGGPVLAAPSQGKKAAPQEEVKVVLGQRMTRTQFEKEYQPQWKTEATTLSTASERARQDNVPPGERAPWESLPVYQQQPRPDAATEADLQEALKELKVGFYLGDWFGQPRVLGGIPAVLRERGVGIGFQLEDLRDDKGRKVDFQPLDAGDAPAAMRLGGDSKEVAQFVIKPREGQTFPETFAGWKGSGTVRVRTPQRYKIVSFTAADVGKARDGFTLTRWEGGRIILEDAQGRLKARTSSQDKGPRMEDVEKTRLVGLTAQGRPQNPKTPYDY